MQNESQITAPRVFCSIDYDGCLMNKPRLLEFLETGTLRHVATANKPLIDLIKQLNPKNNPVHLLIGSNRQSWDVDQLGMRNYRGSVSCFPEYGELTQTLNGIFEPFLMADFQNKLEAGTSFAKIKTDTPPHPEYQIDDSKRSLLIAQMYHISKKYPLDTNYLYFFDDLGGLLNDLHTFFTKNTDYIPKNMVLNVISYENAEIFMGFAPIQGSYESDLDLLTSVFDNNNPVWENALENGVSYSTHMASKEQIRAYAKNVYDDVNSSIKQKIRNAIIMDECGDFAKYVPKDFYSQSVEEKYYSKSDLLNIMIKYMPHKIINYSSSSLLSANFIDFIDSNNNSPFMTAADNGDIEMLKAFLHGNEQENLDQHKVQEAIGFAMRSQHYRVVSFLRSRLCEAPAVIQSHARKPESAVKSSRFFGSATVHPMGEKPGAKKIGKPPESKCCVML